MVRVPCISIRQKGEIFFLAKFKAEELKNFVTFHFRDPYYDLQNGSTKIDKYIDQLKKNGIKLVQDPNGIQRKMKLNKIKDIREYITESEINFFPNTVVLSVDIQENKIFEQEYNEIIDEGSGEISIPAGTNISIIDGQHRLAGIFTSDEETIKSIDIPAVLLFNVSVSTAAKLFLDINGKQSIVNKSLIYDLYGEINDKDVEILKEYNMMCQKLYKDKKSPLYRQIKMLGIGDGSISQSFFIDTVKKAVDRTELSNKDIQLVYNHIYMYLKAFQRTFEDDWTVPLDSQNKTSRELDEYAESVLRKRKSQLVKTNGFGAIMKSFPEVYSITNGDYDRYINIVSKLKDKIDWTEYHGTGIAAQNKIADKINKILKEVESDHKTKRIEAKTLIEKGREQGHLTLSEVMSAFSDVDLNKEQVENLYEVLGNLGIEVRI